MSGRTILILFLAVIVLAAPFQPPLSGEEPKKCKLCNNTGKLPCKYHAERKDLELCSYRLTFDCGCLGLGWTPCMKNEELHPAETKAAIEEMDIERKKLQSWLDARRNIYDLQILGPDHAKAGVEHFESEHFRYVYTMTGTTVYKIKVSAHQRLHLYALRCEETFTKFAEMIGIPLSYQPCNYGKWQVLLWGKVEQQLKASQKMVGNTQYPLATANARLLTITPFESINNLPSEFDDEKLHHHVMHNIVHLFFEEWGGWVDGCFPNWFYEGTAHWIEYYLFNQVQAHCTDEAGELLVVRDKKWERLVYDLVKEKKDTPVQDLTYVKMQDLDFKMRLKGWSLIDWLWREKGPEKIQEFVKILKATKNEAQAWRDVFALTLDEVDPLWRPWVLERFGPRNILKIEKESEIRAEEFIERQKMLVKSLPY